MSRGGRDRSRLPWIRQHSAGGVVVRRTEGDFEFLTIMPAHRDRWQLPKGTIDRGETSAQAAVREVREEGGVEARIIADLGPINFYYQGGHRRFAKTVDFYLMRYDGGDPANHDHEVQEARWMSIEDLGRLAFPTERSVVERAREILSGGGLISSREEVSPGPQGAP